MSDTKNTLEKLRQEEREARRNLILDAAVRLFSSMPFRQVGMRDIAAEAGMSAASLYRYFADRDDLFIEAFMRESQMIAAEFDRYMADNHNLGDPLVGVAKVLAHYLIDNESFFRMMTYFMVGAQIKPEALERFNQTERHLLNVFEDAFKSAGVTENLRLLSHAMFAAINGIVITFRNYPGRDLDEARRHILRLSDLAAETFRLWAKK
ncbi:transcriptional regulator, TetR family [Desulfarculus baarsii DSM 2075]|uniref:Transcriptional regulator, TetR family n=1 Tax=Desulfarculus baarsii (strain ATCC 33931 / DSM 2075 / LMG 7858 / VKM B-1802 / 2st14) TaxID=644282 RepID=E1QEM3_DESB2|nr:TetR/AcrR family transcriptional regulator [Desulfarculus baarsii]ADK84009.1 transcriptional regulator, TetR family [Desulfarculus baarsii DSM 2075]